MNYFFILALSIFTTLSCNNEPAVQAEQVVQAETETAQETPVAPKKVKAIWAKPDTTKPVRRNYHISTARSTDQIKKDYPYDIDLKMANGSTTNSSTAFATNGKPSVLIFWLTTCVPCRYEMAAIQKKFADLKEEADFNLYAISTDFPKNYEQFTKRVEESNWPWETYLDVNREFMQILPGNLNGLPQTFILDKEGNIVGHKRKYRHGDEDKLFEEIKAIAAN